MNTPSPEGEVMMQSPKTGGCLCGAVRYHVAGGDSFVLCHCNHCRKISGSAFSVNLMVTSDAFEISGSVGTFEDRGDSGNIVKRHFCSHCGSSLYSLLSSGMVAVKVGSMDHLPTSSPAAQYWTGNAADWIGLIGSVPEK